MSNALPNFNAQSTSNEMSGSRTTTIQVPSSSLMRHTRSQETQLPGTNFSQIGFAPNLLNPNSLPSQQFFPAQREPLQQPASNVEQPTVSGSENNMSKMNANGWVSPVYSQPDWSRLSPRSVPNQFQAPASQAAQPSAYPTR